MTAQTYIHRGRLTLRRWASDSQVRTGASLAAHAAAGFFLSAASLGNAAQPLAMGLACGVTGWSALAAGVAGILGYWVFWGAAGYQGMVWAALGCLLALTLGKRRVTQEAPLLIPAIAGFCVSATGLAFQILYRDEIPLGIYLLRIVLAAASAGLFARVSKGRNAITDWIAAGVGVLALAQAAPLPWLSLGYLAAGVLGVRNAFAPAALAGLALDLAGVTPIPMTAVLCLGFFLRLIPWGKGKLGWMAPALSFVVMMPLCGGLDVTPLPGLALGGILGTVLPQRAQITHRRGETGAAQVRLELMAGVLSQTQQLLLEDTAPPIDEGALLARTRERACGGCPNRKGCRDLVLPADSLHKVYADAGSLTFPCRKPGRMLLELRRSQEQLRSLRADRDRQRQYREAVIQQYQFLSEYLRSLSDQLPHRCREIPQHFQPEVGVCTVGKHQANGDRCLWFHGTGGLYYILLCDGMGTGLGAAQEAKSAAAMLRQMLRSGFPAEYALRSLNSLLCLRSQAGAVTVDLAEIRIDSGWATVYKWGAAPSWVLRSTGAEKIGTAGPPPGLSVAETRETVERLSLRRGEVLILLSDGVDGEAALRRKRIDPGEPPGEVAAKLLAHGASDGGDDATAAVIRLIPTSLST